MAADALAPYIVINSHETDYIELIGPCFTQRRILTSCIISVEKNDVKLF